MGDGCSPVLCVCQPGQTRAKHSTRSWLAAGTAQRLAATTLQSLALLSHCSPYIDIIRITPGISPCSKLLYTNKPPVAALTLRILSFFRLCYSLTSLASLHCSDFYVSDKDHQLWKCKDFSLISNSSYLFLCWYSCQAEALSCGTQGAQAIVLKIVCRSSKCMIRRNNWIIKYNLIFLYL